MGNLTILTLDGLNMAECAATPDGPIRNMTGQVSLTLQEVGVELSVKLVCVPPEEIVIANVYMDEEGLEALSRWLRQGRG